MSTKKLTAEQIAENKAKAEQAKVEQQAKADQEAAEQAKAEQEAAEQAKAEQEAAEQAKAEQEAAEKEAAEKAGDIDVFPNKSEVSGDESKKFDKEAEGLFAEYPDNDAFHFTSDGLAFFQQGDARNHASSLEKKEVISKVRK